MALSVTIVIPTYNRVQLLARMLPTYLSQDCGEIIVVDDHSVVAVESLLKNSGPISAGNCQLRVIRNAQRLQQPASRMVGVRAAREAFVFFGEDDAFLSPGHVETLFRALRECAADGVASYWRRTTSFNPDPAVVVRMSVSSSASDFINVQDVAISLKHRLTRPVRVPWLHTLALMKKDLILKHGFDSNYKGNAFREETDFYLRASYQGAKFFLVDASPAFHYKGSLNSTGGQHRRVSPRSFLWYEYWVARNHHHFLKRNASALRALGHKRGPLLETVRYMLRRGLGYPGSLRYELRRRFGATRTDSG